MLSGLEGIEPRFLMFLIALAVWTLPWKGYALWLAARNRHPWWFVALLLLNTVAILEIIYIFAVGRPTEKKNSSSVVR